MNHRDFLTILAPPVILFGVVIFLTRRQSSLEDLGDDEHTVPTFTPQHPAKPRLRNGRSKMMPAIGRRQTARKLYGSAVLASQAAGSMRKLALTTDDREVANISVKLQQVSNELMTTAKAHDAGFVQSKMTS